ncbi:bifunctional folylpolyglutamate synthase/dihydrofolate synthase [Desulfobulbus alkaliphilus]|nr:bifunctional folylpolyglutamate synthase/dihydrofolate synthase [Desulfobulbus alkaliphilus]
MNYQQATAYLDRLQLFKIKLGLETTAELLADLGDPQQKMAIIHIAGTNGKGSVGATLLSILTTAGYRTGFYSSPHLISVRERFRIGDAYITEEDFARLMDKVRAVAGDRQPTYFECTTLLALLWFAEQDTEIVILETGMGGRLDATNVVSPLITVLTDIEYDHEQYLGTSLEAIAGEKAGIIKPGVPVVFSGRATPALPVIEQRCREQQSPLYLLDRDFSGHHAKDNSFVYHPMAGPPGWTLPQGLAGPHQAINTSLALAALELVDNTFPVSRQALTAGLRQVSWPGRMEICTWRHHTGNKRFLLDGAHNQAGVLALQQALTTGYPRQKLLLIWGNMADKQLTSALASLIELAATVIFTRTKSNRFADPADLRAQLSITKQAKCSCAETVEEALERAVTIMEDDDLACVAGSLYLIGRARHILQREMVR